MTEENKCKDCKKQCSFLFQEEIDCSNNGYPLFEPSDDYKIKQLETQLTEAKEIIRNFLEYYELKHAVCGFDSEKQKEKAKAFLNSLIN